MRTEQIYREATRGNHKLLGIYLALWAWKRKVDCVSLSREVLLPYLGLKRMQNRRVNWLTADVKSLFPYSKTTRTTRTGAYATLYLSRYEIKNYLLSGAMTDEERVKLFLQEELKTGIVKLPTEDRMVGIVAGMVHGLSEFSAPTVKKKG